MKLLISLMLLLNVLSPYTIPKDIRGNNVLDPIKNPFSDTDYSIVFDKVYKVNVIIYSNGQKDILFDARGTPIDAEVYLPRAWVEENTLNQDLGKRSGIVPGEPDSAVINSYYETYGNEYQVSSWAQNDYGGVTISAIVSVTSDYGFSVNIGSIGTGKIISKICDLGLEFNYQSSSETGYKVSFAVPQGTRGCIFFRPIFMNYNGLYIDYDNYGHRTVVMTPEMNGYFTNGVFRLVTVEPI